MKENGWSTKGCVEQIILYGNNISYYMACNNNGIIIVCNE